MVEVRQTEVFSKWLRELRDRQARPRIQKIGSTVIRRGRGLVILLAGGDKRTQDRDIKTAMELARNL